MGLLQSKYKIISTNEFKKKWIGGDYYYSDKTPFDFIDSEEVYSLRNILTPIPFYNTKNEKKLDAGKFPKNINKIYYYENGINDSNENPWIIVCKLDNNIFAYFIAQCDLTGFKCQGEMKLYLADSLEILIDQVMTEQIRKRFNNFQLS